MNLLALNGGEIGRRVLGLVCAVSDSTAPVNWNIWSMGSGEITKRVNVMEPPEPVVVGT